MGNIILTEIFQRTLYFVIVNSIRIYIPTPFPIMQLRVDSI